MHTRHQSQSNRSALSPLLAAHFDAMPSEFRETDPVIRDMVADALRERYEAKRDHALSRTLVRQAVTERAARTYRETASAMERTFWPALPVYPGARLQLRNGMPLLLNTREAVEAGLEPIAYLHRDPYDRALKITGERPEGAGQASGVASWIAEPFPDQELSTMPDLEESLAMARLEKWFLAASVAVLLLGILAALEIAL